MEARDEVVQALMSAPLGIVADQLGLPPSTLYSWIRKGEVPSYREGQYRMVMLGKKLEERYAEYRRLAVTQVRVVRDEEAARRRLAGILEAADRAVLARVQEGE